MSSGIWKLDAHEHGIREMKSQQRQDVGAKVPTHEKVGVETVDTGEGVVSSRGKEIQDKGH